MPSRRRSVKKSKPTSKLLKKKFSTIAVIRKRRAAKLARKRLLAKRATKRVLKGRGGYTDEEKKSLPPKQGKLPVTLLRPAIEADDTPLPSPSDDLDRLSKMPNYVHPDQLIGEKIPPGLQISNDHLDAINPYSPDYKLDDNPLLSDIQLYRDEMSTPYSRYKRSKFVRTANKYVPKGTFSLLGGMVGGPLGAYAGRKFAELAGFGEYKVKKNSLVLGEGQSPAYMHQTNGNAVIRHREYIQDIVSSSTPNAFNNQVFPINPGMTGTFPWLSALAQQYEQYRIRGMVFEFKSTYADAIASSAANSTIGYVIMGTNYNAVYPPFMNKQQMDNTEYSTSAKPSMSFYHPIECAPTSIATDLLYIRSGAPPANADLRMYDLGNFQIASGGIAAQSVVIGELWCTYEVELIKPISTTAHGLNVLSDHYYLINPSTGFVSDWFGASQQLVDGSSIGGTIVKTGTGYDTYVFPPSIQDGNYLVTVQYQASATNGAGSIPTITLTNCSAVEVYNHGSAAVASAGGGATDLSLIISFVVNIDAPSGTPASIYFAGGQLGLSTNITGDLIVTQIDSDIKA